MLRVPWDRRLPSLSLLLLLVHSPPRKTHLAQVRQCSTPRDGDITTSQSCPALTGKMHRTTQKVPFPAVMWLCWAHSARFLSQARTERDPL